MPASGQTHDDSLRTQIVRWLYDHPGLHRPAQISTGLGVEGSRPRMRVHNEVARLYRDGQLTRTSEQVKGKKRPLTSYTLSTEARDSIAGVRGDT